MISQEKTLTQKLAKIIFVFTGGILAVITALQIVTNPGGTIISLALLTTLILIAVKPLTGLYILLILPIAGELFRPQLAPLPPLLPSDLLLPAFIIIWFIRNLGNITPLISSCKKILIPLFTFYVIAGLSLIYSLTFLTPPETLSSSLYLFRFIQYSILCVITFSLIRNKKDISGIIKVASLTALGLAIIGFIQLKLFPDLTTLEEAGWDPHINRLVSTWLDPNFLGGFFAFIISLLAGITAYTKNTKHKTALLIIIALLGTALFLTYSRSAYLALITGILVIGLLKSRKIIIIALILGLFGLAISDRARDRTAELTQSITAVFTESALTPDPTAKLRIQNWEQTVFLIKKRPLLGSGFNTLKFVKHKEGFVENTDIHSASGSDSSLLTILATTGIPGLIAFTFMYLKILATAFREWKKNTIPYFKGYSLGFLAGICALTIHSFFVNSLLFAPIMLYFWILTGALIWIKHTAGNVRQ